MVDSPASDDDDEPIDELPAGDFATWRTDVLAALRGDGESDVPCGTCTACCTSSQFVHVGPDDVGARAHIPASLLFPAPGRPPGHSLLGFDERGHCPMLVDGGCSIYDHRPRTCRTYDCRVLTAAGVELGEPEKAAIDERARRWRFTLATADDTVGIEAIQAAATYVRDNPEVLPAGPPLPPAQLATLSLVLHDLFLARGPDGDTLVEPDAEAVRVAIRHRTR